MAFGATAVAEVRGTGADTNGGWYDAGLAGAGTDYSRQNTAQIAVTDAVTNNTTTVTSATASFSSLHIGNAIYLSGTGTTTGWYFVTAVTNATTITVDRATGSTGGTGVTLNLGGALATLNAAIGTTGPALAGNIVWWQNSTNTITAAITVQNSGSGSAGSITVNGYDVSRGDRTGNRPILTSATASVNLIATNGKFLWALNNIKFTHTGSTRGNAIACGAATNSWALNDCVFDGVMNAVYGGNVEGAEFQMDLLSVNNCDIKNCQQNGLRFSTGTVSDCDIHATSGATNGDAILSANSTKNIITVARCNLYSNGRSGIRLTNASVTQLYVHECTFYGNTTDGITSLVAGSNSLLLGVEDNIFSTNGTSAGYGVNLNNANYVAGPNRNNAYFNNFTGARNKLAVGQNDVTLTGDPFTNAAGGNFALNNTAGAGAACRAAGFPGAFPAGTTTGYLDIGAAQHQDTGGSGGPVGNNFRGGFCNG